MEVKIRTREKVKAETLKPGEGFRPIEKQRAMLAVDLSQNDMFKAGPDGKGPTLREDMVYFVDLLTGVVGEISKNVDVYKLVLMAEEVL